jgi:mRNA deadenylase 3'-5' endonuclease subunit Ccr4
LGDLLLILLGCVPGASSLNAAPAVSTPEIRVVAFNVLAPSWAYPGLYPAAAAPFLDRVLRRGHIIDFMRSRAASTDIFALQETTTAEFAYFKAAMPEYVAFQA